LASAFTASHLYGLFSRLSFIFGSIWRTDKVVLDKPLEHRCESWQRHLPNLLMFIVVFLILSTVIPLRYTKLFFSVILVSWHLSAA
jgi:hypothetical protein